MMADRSRRGAGPTMSGSQGNPYEDTRLSYNAFMVKFAERVLGGVPKESALALLRTDWESQYNLHVAKYGADAVNDAMARNGVKEKIEEYLGPTKH